MSQEICSDCGELIEHGAIALDGTPIYPGDKRLDPRPRTRVCLECQPRKYDADDDKPAPPGFYKDLYQMREERRQVCLR